MQVAETFSGAVASGFFYRSGCVNYLTVGLWVLFFCCWWTYAWGEVFLLVDFYPPDFQSKNSAQNIGREIQPKKSAEKLGRNRSAEKLGRKLRPKTSAEVFLVQPQAFSLRSCRPDGQNLQFLNRLKSSQSGNANSSPSVSWLGGGCGALASSSHPMSLIGGGDGAPF